MNKYDGASTSVKRDKMLLTGRANSLLILCMHRYFHSCSNSCLLRQTSV